MTPSGRQPKYRAHADQGEIDVEVDAALIRDDSPRATYLFVEKIYNWFGAPSDKIPYVVGQGDQRMIDVDTLRRGGKKPNG